MNGSNANDLQRFIDRRKDQWVGLSERLQELERRGKFLVPEDALHIVNAYRSACADLAWLNARYPDAEVCGLLNDLVSRAHIFLSPVPTAGAISFGALLLAEIPQAVRRNARGITLTSALFILVSLYAAFVAMNDPSRVDAWVPPAMREMMDEGKMWTGFMLPFAPFISTMLVINNVLVAMGATAGGVTFGIYTAYALVGNALMLGAVSGFAFQSPISARFFGFVAGHGPTELTAIFISLTSGFLIPFGLLRAGDLPRWVSLRRSARDSALLFVAAFLMLIAAGIVEAFISPNEKVPASLRAAVGFLLLFAFLLFFARAGKTNSGRGAGAPSRHG